MTIYCVGVWISEIGCHNQKLLPNIFWNKVTKVFSIELVQPYLSAPSAVKVKEMLLCLHCLKSFSLQNMIIQSDQTDDHVDVCENDRSSMTKCTQKQFSILSITADLLFLSDPCAHGVRSLGSNVCHTVTHLFDLVKALVKDPSWWPSWRP